MQYSAPLWLPGGHLQTIYPALWARQVPVIYRRVRWTTPDQDFIDIDFVEGQPAMPFVVLFHGLEGSSDSHYARALMAHLQATGWSGAVVHFRGCSGELNRLPRFYHSGDVVELEWILQRFAEYQRAMGASHLYAVGVSLGGNALLRWLGEAQSRAQIVNGACAISAPLNLAASGATLGRATNKIYTRMFLRSLKKKCVDKLHQFPELFDRTKMLAARNLYEFDNVVTAPLHSYKNTDDYWNRASALSVLADITVPTLILNAQNDPFLPGRYLPTHIQGQGAGQSAKQVKLEYPLQGGHVGFATAGGKLDWLPRRIVHFLQTTCLVPQCGGMG